MGAVGTGGRVGVRRVEYRWLLPALLTQEITATRGDGRPAPRSARDWAVDVVLFVAAVWGGLAVWAPLIEQVPNVPRGLRAADLAAGLVTCGALWWRRRWPVPLTLAATVFGTFSASSSIGALVLMFSVAVHRRPSVTAAVAGVFWLPSFVYPLVWPDPQLPYAGEVLLGFGVTAGVTGWGMFVRARRQLVVSWRERAALAEAEQHHRIADARRLERLRIAREMHDVLGHRLSLLSLHAGALEFRPNAPPEQVAQAAGVVRASARQALVELRQVIGLLRRDDAEPELRPEPLPRQGDAGPVLLARQDERADDGEGAGRTGDHAPVPAVPAAPGLSDLAGLVDESRRAGTTVLASYYLTEPHTVWPVAGRGGYRIVQEALTNARKHAPGQPVTVLVDGSAASGLRIEARNPTDRSTGTGTAARPGLVGGTGLVGLAERAAQAGGTLRHEVTSDGEFRLCAWLSWLPIEDGDIGCVNANAGDGGSDVVGEGAGSGSGDGHGDGHSAGAGAGAGAGAVRGLGGSDG